MSRHGLRIQELCDLRWDQIDFNTAQMQFIEVQRRITGHASKFRSRELRWLRQLQREQKPQSAFVFTSERCSPFSSHGVHKLVAQLGVKAKLPFKIHPHMCRHFVGFHFVNKEIDVRTIQAYLGHKNIQHTVRYTALSAKPFKNLLGYINMNRRDHRPGNLNR